MNQWLLAALRAFHRALRSGGTLAVSVSRPLGPLSPALRALAVAGLGGMTLVACAEGAGPASLSAAGGVAGVGPATLVEFKGAVPAGEAAARAASCVALMAQAEARGAPLAERAAQVEGLARPGAGGRAEWDGARISPLMREAQFSRLAALHERGHCEDEAMPGPGAIAALPGATREWSIHRFEVYADTWAALAALREGVPGRAVQEWADLRAVGVLMNGVRRNGGDAWARYHSAPAIDDALARADKAGEGAVRGLTDGQLGRVARAIAEAAALDRGAHARLVAGVPRIRLEGGRASLPPELPPGYGKRLELALARTGVVPRPSDALRPSAR